MTELVVVGAGGHGAVVAEAAERMQRWTSIRFVDDAYPEKSTLYHWTVTGVVETLFEERTECVSVAVAIGDARRRTGLGAQFLARGFDAPVVVHPAAAVSRYAELGPGTVVLAGAAVNIGAEIGRFAIVNTGATVDHDCRISDGVHVAPGAHLAADVTVGPSSWLGIGSAIRQGAVIGARCVIGAGAAVVSDWPDDSMIGGVPARQL